ncbi:MAG: hypothetical protein RL385_4473 [Pseudomonadota bacterium]|jgi:hypothetical protein
MGGHYSHSPVLTRGALVLLAVHGAGACGQEGLIGDSDEEVEPSGGRGSRDDDSGEDC